MSPVAVFTPANGTSSTPASPQTNGINHDTMSNGVVSPGKVPMEPIASTDSAPSTPLVAPVSVTTISSIQADAPIYTPSPAVKPLEGDELRAALLKQLEFYFSKDNLSSDTYLVSNMSTDLYVPVDIVANFKLIKALTSDLSLIVDVLRSSSQVTVDPAGKLVKPNISVQRSTIILRDIPSDVPEDEIRAIFASEGCGAVKSLRCDIGDTWFVTFETETEAVDTLLVIREKKFRDKPIQGRIKSENLLKSVYVPRDRSYGYNQSPMDGMVNVEVGPEDYGYYVGPGAVPYAPGRPGQWGYNPVFPMNGGPYPYVDNGEYMNNGALRHGNERRRHNNQSGPRTGNNSGSRNHRRNDGENQTNAVHDGQHNTQPPQVQPLLPTPPQAAIVQPIPIQAPVIANGSQRRGPSGGHHSQSNRGQVQGVVQQQVQQPVQQPHVAIVQPVTQSSSNPSQSNSSSHNSNGRYNQSRRKTNQNNGPDHRANPGPRHSQSVPVGLDAFPPLPNIPGAAVVAVPVRQGELQQQSPPVKSYSTVANTEPKHIELPKPEPKEKKERESAPSTESTKDAKESKDSKDKSAATPSQPNGVPRIVDASTQTRSRDTEKRSSGSRANGRNSSKDRQHHSNRTEHNRQQQHHQEKSGVTSPPLAVSSVPQPMSYAQILKTKAKPVEKVVSPPPEKSTKSEVVVGSKADSAFESNDKLDSPTDDHSTSSASSASQQHETSAETSQKTVVVDESSSKESPTIEVHTFEAANGLTETALSS